MVNVLQNTATKLHKALQEIDRMLDILEPGSLALSFNGGKVPSSADRMHHQCAFLFHQSSHPCRTIPGRGQ